MLKPESLGRYEILDELGRGGMGIVMKGRDPKIDRLVALKIIKFEDIIDSGRESELIERFYIEARAAGKLTHPNIVTIYDVGEESGMSYIAMEFVEGRDLSVILREEKKMPFKRAANFIIQIAEGLAFAHEQGIIHRDIKPGNILVQKNDKVKITDFGLARLQSAGSVTQTGHAVGSPLYMSPEQVQSLPLDGRSDMFSLGVMFYELVTGVKSFDADSLTSIIFKIIKDEPPLPSSYDKSISPAVDAVISKMMAKDPEKRYKSCSDVAKALKKVSSLPDGFDQLTGSDAAMTVNFATSGNEDIDGARPKSKGLWLAIVALIMAVSGGALWYLQGAKNQSTDSRQVAAVKAPTKQDAPTVLKGSVTINSPVLGKAFIDSRPAGQTPVTGRKLAPGKHTVEVRADSYKPWSEEIEIRSGELLTLTADMAPADGVMTITAIPKGSIIFVDGKERGSAPMTTNLTAGTHKVTIKKRGYRSYVKEIKIDSDKTATISAKLYKLGFGSLHVTAIPWADIYINKKKIGPTPKLIEKVMEGKLTVKLVNPGFKPYSEVVRLKKGSRLTIFHEFTESEALKKSSTKGSGKADGETGSLKITSKPSGMVFIDGKTEGKTPVVVTDLSVGSHAIVIKREGQIDYKRSVIVVKGKVILLAVE